MTKASKLETKTIVAFYQSNKPLFFRTYKGRLDFKEGEIITLEDDSQPTPKESKDYVIGKEGPKSTLILSSDNAARPDMLLRYYSAKLAN